MNKQLNFSRRFNRLNPVDTKHSANCVVKEGLSMSPSDVASMTERGFAVSSQIDESLFYDGDSTDVISVPLERLRGIDIAQAWEASQDAKKKFAKAQIVDKANYGD